MGEKKDSLSVSRLEVEVQKMENRSFPISCLENGNCRKDLENDSGFHFLELQLPNWKQKVSRFPFFLFSTENKRKQ